MSAAPGGDKSAPAYDFDPVFKLWSKYEDVTIHFNDLILRLRFQALAGVAGLSALVGVFGRDVEDVNMRSAVVSGVFFLLALFWVAIWALDRFYYDKLLCGAVHALLNLEKFTKEPKASLQIDLSTSIEDSFLGTVRLKHPGRGKDGRSWFYGIVFVALLGGVVLHLWPAASAWILELLNVPQLPIPASL
jgi:hypothetical protein